VQTVLLAQQQMAACGELSEQATKKRLLKQITNIFKSGKKRKSAAKRTKRVDSNTPF